MEEDNSLLKKIRRFFIGKPRPVHDQSMAHRLSLIAFFAWVGLGADGLSSSCYGPPEAFLALGQHYYLGIFVALASAITIFVISAGYSQIIELFPQGGGGYLVATKLLSPFVGMVSGCALIIDYVLTIAVSVASGSDAIFSFLAVEYLPYKTAFSVAVLIILIIMNLRGVKESVVPLVPIFLTFVIMHVAAIIYACVTHFMIMPEVAHAIKVDVSASISQIGFLGMLILLLRAYSMGAGTYTGIEAVSNGLPILREPREKTGKRTMNYMSISLAFMVVGIMTSYLLYKVEPQFGKTLNAVLFANISAGWNSNWAAAFILITLVSEALILYIAAQTGFLGAPRVLANMASDGWMPKRFALLSDRLVIGNGILIMGGFAILLMIFAKGSVPFLIVLYSINVFITFVLSQLGMVKHWWQLRKEIGHWYKKIVINGLGLVLSAFILISVAVIKFHEGGWLTLLVTGMLVAFAVLIKQNYNAVEETIRKFDSKFAVINAEGYALIPKVENQEPFDPKAHTAVFFVKNFNGVGLQTISTVLRSYKNIFKNVLVVQFGLINAATLSHILEVEERIKGETSRYVDMLKSLGYYSEGFCLTGIDTVEEISKIIPTIQKSFTSAVFFGGQIVFPNESYVSKLMHNYTSFAIQRRLFEKGIPFFVVPVKIS